VISSEAADEPLTITPTPMAEVDMPETAADSVQVEPAAWATVEPELAIAEAELEPSPTETPPILAEAKPDGPSVGIASTFSEQEPLAMETAPVGRARSEIDPVLVPPEPVRTETPMPSAAFPALTPSAAEKLEPLSNEPSPMPSAATSPNRYRLPTAPVLMPVPLSGQIPPPPLIRPPAVTPEPARTITPKSGTPKSAPPPEVQPTPIIPTETTPQSESSPMSASMSAAAGLASPETATAAAGSVTNLVRALTSDRNPQVHSGGPTIADLVREEIRPMLKEWIDSNLPPLVERLVRAEIERVISRATV
jgi:cell pole-organizing protein PopZ